MKYYLTLRPKQFYQMRTSTFFLIFLLFLLSFSVRAQFKIIGESKAFEEPDNGSVSKIIQLKNGNTFFLTITKDGEVDSRIYDVTHTEKAESFTVPAYGAIKLWAVQNVFEVKQEVVLFISAIVDKAPVLYRLIFNGNDGKLKEEKVLHTVSKIKGAVRTAIDNIFKIKKDAVGENYVISVYDFSGEEKDKRVEIVQYGEDNLETNRTFLVTGNEDEFKYFIYVDMQVLDTDKVNVVLYNGEEKYFYNYRKGRMVMASIDRKVEKVTYTNIKMPEVPAFKNCLTQYIVKTKKMYLLLRKLDNKGRDTGDDYFITYNTLNNSNTARLVENVDEKTNQSFKERLGRSYRGSFISFDVNEDGSHTIICEEKFSQEGGNFFTGVMHVANYTIDGKIQSSYMVPKIYNTNNFSEYKIPFYVNAGKTKYMLLNDTEKNNNPTKGYVPIIGVSDTDAFIYKLDGDKFVPEREMIFGSGGNWHNLAALPASNFNGNTFITLKLNKKDSNNKAASLVWIELQ